MRLKINTYWPLIAISVVITIIFTAGWYMGSSGYDVPIVALNRIGGDS